MKQIRNVGRPLTARSVIASLLLGTHPPRMAGGVLVRWAALFGISEGTARVALSRMVAAGELEADGGVYSLTGRLAERQVGQDLARRPQSARWDGSWKMGIVAGERRSARERNDLRRAMGALRMAELREGVWLRPDNLRPSAGPDWAYLTADGQVHWFTSRPDNDPAALAARLWDLEGWAEGAVDSIAAMRATLAPLEAGDTGALTETFVVAARALRHIHADPLLPVALLPAGWPGTELRSAYDEYEKALGALYRKWYRETAT
jgi:phenylacetic acid degradation operon negative regulatory protein